MSKTLMPQFNFFLVVPFVVPVFVVVLHGGCVGQIYVRFPDIDVQEFYLYCSEMVPIVLCPRSSAGMSFEVIVYGLY